MPFYVFSCPSCDLLLDYWSKRPTSAVPTCPHCGGPLEREVQDFHAGRGEMDADAGDGLGGGFVDIPLRVFLCFLVAERNSRRNTLPTIPLVLPDSADLL